MTCGDMNTMTDTVRSYMEELVIPAIPNSCPAVRNQAIRALGLCTLCSQEVSRKFLPVFLQVCIYHNSYVMFVMSVILNIRDINTL